MQDLVIVGGGFAGIWAAMSAAGAAACAPEKLRITLISRDPYLTNRPRLYEGNPRGLRDPFLPILDKIGVTFQMGSVSGIDAARRAVSLTAAAPLRYDTLILTAGSVLSPFRVSGGAHGFNIDSYKGALALDDHLRAILADPDAPGHNTFVLVGAGFTGIELATEMRARIAAHSTSRIAQRASLVLVDCAPTLSPQLGANPRPHIEAALEKARVEVRLGQRIARMDAQGITFDSGERLAVCTVIITTGLAASPLTGELSTACDALGRLPVDETLHVQGVNHVFAAGDVAHAHVDDDHLALMSCQHAETMGKFAGYNAAREMLGLTLRPYRQPRYVTCLDLGASGALFTSGWERTVEMCGAEAKALKSMIVTDGIALPDGDRAGIFAAARPPS